MISNINFINCNYIYNKNLNSNNSKIELRRRDICFSKITVK